MGEGGGQRPFAVLTPIATRTVADKVNHVLTACKECTIHDDAGVLCCRWWPRTRKPTLKRCSKLEGGGPGDVHVKKGYNLSLKVICGRPHLSSQLLAFDL